MGRSRAAREPPKGGALQQFQLILPFVFGFLVADVLSNRRFIPAHGRYEVPAGPEVLADEVPFVVEERPSNVDGALEPRQLLLPVRDD